MSRTADAFGKVREVGGAIVAEDGRNLTADAAGAGDFEGYLKGLCGNHADALHSLLTQIEEAVRTARFMQEANQNPLTDPKCYSKPIIRLQTGCSAEVEFVARNKKEQACS